MSLLKFTISLAFIDILHQLRKHSVHIKLLADALPIFLALAFVGLRCPELFVVVRAVLLWVVLIFVIVIVPVSGVLPATASLALELSVNRFRIWILPRIVPLAIAGIAILPLLVLLSTRVSLVPVLSRVGSELVVLLSLVFVSENLVGLVDLLEIVRVAFVNIWVVFFGQLIKFLLDLALRGRTIDAQNFVVIFLKVFSCERLLIAAPLDFHQCVEIGCAFERSCNHHGSK